QQSVDDNPIDNEAAMNPIGDLSLSSDDGTRGMYQHESNY
ncbi:unnamed protein product, partial [Rotaria magnacalcarata]